MLHLMTTMIIFLLLVCAVLILMKKVNYFRQQSNKLKKKEYEFIYEFVAEGKLKPDQAFKMDDFAERRMTDQRAFHPEKTGNELGLNEVRSLISERIDGLPEEELRNLLKFLEEEQTLEQRRYDRKDFFKIIDYTVGDRFYRDFIQNISTGGVFIETSEIFSEGQHIIMTFIAPDHQGPFKINGKIVRIHSDGVGVTFELKSQVQEMVLKSFIEKIQNS
jgi:Tfp pilus assembly protein PilZ